MRPKNPIHRYFMRFITLLCSALFLVSTTAQGKYAKVNGLKMYYEMHGKGTGVPLVLIHGGGSTIESNWSKILPLFAKHRRVIALEEQAHGRTSDRDAPSGFDKSADDVAALLKQLNIKQADLFGFSNGASIGLQVAIRHPELVRKLVFGSSLTKRSGAPSQFWSMFDDPKLEMMPQPLTKAFLKVNPSQVALQKMFDRDSQRMKNFPDVADDTVKNVKIPTLILAGDRDVPTLEHSVELTHLFPNARLLIFPGGHGDYLGEAFAPGLGMSHVDITARLVEDFLNL